MIWFVFDDIKFVVITIALYILSYKRRKARWGENLLRNYKI